mgnify:CR=1 FL=1
MSYSKRTRTLKDGSFNGESVLYWMVRDKRFKDNWALFAAQKAALKNKVPLHVCFQYDPIAKTATLREYDFLFKGLKETELKLFKHNIQFHLLKGDVLNQILTLCSRINVGTLITDFSPLKIYKRRLNRVLKAVDCPVYQTDAHNIIPVWKASNKKEFAAHTIRKKINNLLAEFLHEPSNCIFHPYGQTKPSKINWEKVIERLEVDKSVKPVSWITAGEKAAFEKLVAFKTNLNGYNLKRNDPNLNKLSKLSPYFHFGQISTQRVAYEIKKLDQFEVDKEAFLEEMIVRRELAENFCEYEHNYDFFEGFHPWAQKTLNEHRSDEREYIYSSDEFEQSKTHDPLWNAAQNQMKYQGKMHGFMRMYWAKKILEWSDSPERALQIAINLNDKYELDGRDPNGYTGIAWSIGGIHDRAWFERPVFGKIRYMNYNGCKRKFNVNNYIKQFREN